MSARRIAPAVIAGLALVTTTLTACGGSEEPDTAVAGVRDEVSSVEYPVEVENCGRTVTIDAPPERVVSGWPTTTELLIELGVQDRLVGQYNAGVATPRDASADAYGEVEVLSEAAPSREALLAATPDLILGDGEYLFDGTQLPTIEELEADGIEVLLLTTTCEEGETSGMSNVATDLAAIGTALGIRDQTDELTAQVETDLAAVAERTAAEEPVDAAIIASYEGTVFTFEGIYTEMLEAAGGTNVLDGTLPDEDYFGELSAEALTAADPGTVVYLTSGEVDEAALRARLAEDFPTVTAVRENRIVFVPESDSTNLRVLDAVESMADQFDALQ